MATYLVTGGLGFIGSHLVDALLGAGHRVRVLDDMSTGHRANVAGPIELIEGSITDAPLVAQAMADVDGCFHLAAIASVARSNEDWRGTSAINQGGAITVFEAAAKRPGGPAPVVYISSAAVYGDSDQLPLCETTPLRPLTAYGADKLSCELHAQAGGVVHGLPSFGVRPFNVFGPRQDPRSTYSGVISIFIDRALRGDDLPLLGDGGQERDFIYVADVVRFLIAAINAADPSAPVVNLCTGTAIRISKLAETIVRLTGSSSAIVRVPPRSGDIRRSQGNPELAHRLLSVRAQTSLEDGLAKLLEQTAP